MAKTKTKKDRKPTPMKCPKGSVIVRVRASQVVRYDQYVVINEGEWRAMQERAREPGRDADRELDALIEGLIDVNDILDADDIEDGEVVRVSPKDTAVILETLPSKED